MSDPELASYAKAQQKEGRCCTCGFLSRRIRPEPPSRVLPSWGYFEVGYAERGELHELSLFMPLACFKRAANLKAEIDRGGDAATHAVVSRDRNCEHWTAYMPGTAPPEHLGKISRLRAMWLELRDTVNDLVDWLW